MNPSSVKSEEESETILLEDIETQQEQTSYNSDNHHLETIEPAGSGDFPSSDTNKIKPTLKHAMSLVPHEDQPSTSGRYEDDYKEQLNLSLLKALKDGDIESIEKLLTDGASPYATCLLGCTTACHLAAMRTDSALQLLLKTLRSNSIFVPKYSQFHEFEEMSSIDFTSTPKFPNFVNSKCEEHQPQMAISRQLTNEIVTHNCKKFKNHLPIIEPGWRPLHTASSLANYECVELLLCEGADPTLQDNDGQTPLDVASSAYYSDLHIDSDRFEKTVSILISWQDVFIGSLDNKRHPACSSLYGSPLHVAVEMESTKAVNILVNKNIYLSYVYRWDRHGLTPVHICIKKKLQNILQVLVNEKVETGDGVFTVAELDLRDINNCPVLHAAVRNEWVRGVSIIVDAGANLTAKDDSGNTPLHIATTINNINVFNIIINAITDQNIINKQNYHSETALDIAVKHGHTDCVKKLLERRATIKTSYNIFDKFNIFHFTASLGYADILKALLDYESNITKDMVREIDRRKCFMPIHYAIVNNHPDCVKVLLRETVSSDFETSSAGTPLHLAVINNCVDIANILLETYPASINSKKDNGWTALHYACSNGNRDMIKLLLKHGGDLSSIACSSSRRKEITPIELIMDSVQKPTEFFENILNSCITMNRDTTWTNFEIEVDYQILMPMDEEKEQMKVINALIKTGNTYKQRQLLAHPVIESFLNLKLRALLPFFYIMVFVFGVYLIIFSTYVIIVFENKNSDDHTIPRWLSIPAMTVLIYIFGALVIILEILFMNINTRYFKRLETWIKFIAMLLALILPTIVDGAVEEYARHTATIALLLSWIEMMFLFSRIPEWGFYFIMFGKVCRDVFIILLTFICLVIGFSLCFIIQYRSKPPFDGIWPAFVKTLVMATSGFDYEVLITAKNITEVNVFAFEKFVPSMLIFRLLFIAFVFLAVIVLINIMVGVTVNDLHELRIRGNTQRLLQQVEFLVSLDTLLYSRHFKRLLPVWIKEILVMMETIPSCITFSKGDFDSVLYKVLPADSIRTLFELAEVHDQEDDVELYDKTDEGKIQNNQTEILKLKTAVKNLETKIDKILNTLQSRLDI